MKFVIILIVVILIITLFGERISRLIREFIAHRTEDAIRRMMGMPTRKEEKRARKERGNTYKRGDTGFREDSSRHSYSAETEEPIIPKEYAEDVEFIEIKEYSSKTIVEDTKAGKTRIYHESQVEEAEYVEIKER